MSNVLDNILALVTPERLLRDPRATGAGVTVCVIDSGIERAVLEDKYRKQGVAIEPIEGGIFTSDRPEPLPYEGRQSTPHGTTVADIILSLAPQVRLYSADVFGPQGSCEVDVVMRVNYAIDLTAFARIAALTAGQFKDFLLRFPAADVRGVSKALTGVVDAERFAAFGGTRSLPFKAGKHQCAAVKVIDPRGNEVMRVHKLATDEHR